MHQGYCIIIKPIGKIFIYIRGLFMCFTITFYVKIHFPENYHPDSDTVDQ